MVNQYSGNEGYLGWLAMQPRFHRMKLSELDSDELATFSINAWRIPTITGSELFPERYRRTEGNVNALMTWLRDKHVAA
jgi:hypothetical protein